MKDKINNLYDKDNKESYGVLLELENICINSNELYPFFNIFLDMLVNDRSFVRVRGFRMICALAKWDTENKIDNNITLILDELNDEIGTSIRQCLAKIIYIYEYKPKLRVVIKKRLIEIDISKYKETLQGLIKNDIDKVIL